MKRSILIVMILFWIALAGEGFDQTTATLTEAKPANLFAVLSYLFPGFDPFCIYKNDPFQQKTKAKPSPSARGGLLEPLGKECYSLNFDLGFINNKLDGNTIPAAKLKFGF